MDKKLRNNVKKLTEAITDIVLDTIEKNEPKPTDEDDTQCCYEHSEDPESGGKSE